MGDSLQPSMLCKPSSRLAVTTSGEGFTHLPSTGLELPLEGRGLLLGS